MGVVQATIIGSTASYEAPEVDKPDPHTGTWVATISNPGVRGTPFDPGGAVPAVANAASGLWRRHYTGTWSNGVNIGDLAFFTNNSSVYNMADTYVSFGSRSIANQSNYAFEWLGYIYCIDTGVYNLGVTVDDYARIWIGDTAIRGYNDSNANVKGNNGTSYSNNSVSLTAGNYYPIRIWFQEITGDEKMQVYIGATAADSLISLANWPIYYNSATTGFNSHIFPTPGTGAYTTGGSSTLHGTAYDPGGAEASVDSPDGGFYRRTVLGEWYSTSYAATDMNFFDGKTVWDYRADPYVSFGSQDDLQTQYSMYWLGYFQAPATGDYNLLLLSDDQSMCWIGSTAVSGFNGSNYACVAGGATANSVTLTAGQWYPIRIWYVEHYGGNSCQLFIGQTGDSYYNMYHWYQAGRIAYSTTTNGLNYSPRIDAKPGNTWSGLTLYNSPTNNGTYLSFDGVNQYATSAGLNADSSFSIEMWVRTTTDNGGLLTDGLSGYNCSLMEIVSGDLRAGYWVNSTAYHTVQTPIGRYIWHHYVFAYNAAGPQLEIFIDGVRNNHNLGTKVGAGAVLGLFLGSPGSSFGDNSFLAGDLGEFRLWDNLLSDEKALAQYNNTKSAYPLTVPTAHFINPSWTNNMYGANTVFMVDPFYPYNTRPDVNWTITDGVNTRTITNVNRQASGYGRMMILTVDSAVDFNSANNLTLAAP